MRNSVKILLLTLAAAFGLLPLRGEQRPENRAKSDYYFMEAMRQRALDRDGDAQVLLERAYELYPDPSDQPAKFVGFNLVSQAGADSVMFDRGLKMIQRYVRFNPNDTYAAVSLADFYMRGDAPERALPLYAYADSMNPTQPSLALRHAQTLMRLERVDEALKVYRRVETREGRSTQLTYLISLAMLRQQNDTAAALAEIESLLAAKPGDTEALALAMQAYTASNRPDETARLIDKALALEPDNSDLWQFCIQETLSSNGLEASLALFGKALQNDDLTEADKESLLAWYLFGCRPNPETPEEELNAINLRALDLYDTYYPGSLSALIDRSELARRNKDYDETIRLYRQIIDKEPEMDFLRVELIRAYMMNNDEANAIKEGEKAVKELDEPSQNEMARYLLAGAYMNTRRYEDAAKHLRILLDADNSESADDPKWRAGLLSSIADAEQNFKPAAVAAKLYEESIELDPTSLMTKNNYAYMISEKGGDLDRAKQLIDEVIKAEPENPTFLDTAAWVYYKLGQYGPAMAFIDSTLVHSEQPVEAEVLLHAGDIYYRAGIVDRALELWQLGLDANPDSKDLARRLKLKRIPD